MMRREVHWVLLLVLLSTACFKDPSTVDFGVEGGTLQGTVEVGSVYVEMTVEAIRVDGLPTSELTVKAPVQGDGSYSVDVPAGSYVVELDVGDSSARYSYREAGLSFGVEPPDTILINEALSPRTVDFDLSSVRLEIQVSPELNGEEGYLELHRTDHTLSRYERGYQRFASGTVEEGILRIALSAVLPGEYRAELVLGRRAYWSSLFDGEYVWYPGVRDPEQAERFSIQVAQTMDLQADWSGDVSRIAGEVTGAWQVMGLSAPTLALVDPDSNLVRGFRLIQGEGVFDVGVHIPGPVKVAVRQHGTIRWFGGDSFESATIYELQGGQTVQGLSMIDSGIELNMMPPHQNLNSGRIRIYRSADGSEVASWSQGLPSSGPQYRIANLGAGSYLIRFEPRSKTFVEWTDQWYDRALEMENATPVVIETEGEVASVNVELLSGATLSGSVQDHQDYDEGYTVIITPDTESTACGLRALHGSVSDFSIVGLGNGGYKVGVRRGLYYSEEISADIVWFPGVLGWENASVIEVSGLANVEGVVIRMPQDNGDVP